MSLSNLKQNVQQNTTKEIRIMIYIKYCPENSSKRF